MVEKVLFCSLGKKKIFLVKFPRNQFFIYKDGIFCKVKQIDFPVIQVNGIQKNCLEKKMFLRCITLKTGAFRMKKKRHHKLRDSKSRWFSKSSSWTRGISISITETCQTWKLLGPTSASRATAYSWGQQYVQHTFQGISMHVQV